MITQYQFPILNGHDKQFPFVLITIGIMENQPLVRRPSGIEDHQLLFTISGGGQAKNDKKKYSLYANSVYYLSPRSPQYYQPINFPWLTMYVTYRQNQFIDFLDFENGVYSLSSPDDYVDILKQIMNLPTDLNFGEKASVLLYSLLLKIKIDITDNSYYSKIDTLKKAHKYMIAHFRESIELDYLATLCNVSPEHFCRTFKNVYHFTPFEYIINLRMQEAKNMLVSTNHTTGKIGKIIGYESQSHFIQEFKKREHMTPLEFRKLYQSSSNDTQAKR